jgi:hypothetical protein
MNQFDFVKLQAQAVQVHQIPQSPACTNLQDKPLLPNQMMSCDLQVQLMMTHQADLQEVTAGGDPESSGTLKLLKHPFKNKTHLPHCDYLTTSPSIHQYDWADNRV